MGCSLGGGARLWLHTSGPKSAESDTTTVISTLPAANEAGVGVTRKIVVTFSTEMNASSISNESVLLTSTDGNTVAGTVAIEGDTASFTPTSVLSTGAAYTCTVSTAAKDSEGSALAADYSWQFTTAPGVTVGPTGTYRTIQAAIDAVSPGYTIVVSAAHTMKRSRSANASRSSAREAALPVRCS